jgi:hypothetical protein
VRCAVHDEGSAEHRAGGAGGVGPLGGT